MRGTLMEKVLEVASSVKTFGTHVLNFFGFEYIF